MMIRSRIAFVLAAFALTTAAVAPGCVSSESAQYTAFAMDMHKATRTEGHHEIVGPLSGETWTIDTTRVEGSTVGSAYPWVFVSQIDAPDFRFVQPGEFHPTGREPESEVYSPGECGPPLTP